MYILTCKPSAELWRLGTGQKFRNHKNYRFFHTFFKWNCCCNSLILQSITNIRVFIKYNYRGLIVFKYHCRITFILLASRTDCWCLFNFFFSFLQLMKNSMDESREISVRMIFSVGNNNPLFPKKETCIFKVLDYTFSINEDLTIKYRFEIFYSSEY